MRIISGKLKGSKLFVSKKLKLRPTTDRAKEGLFNILENKYNFNNCSVLDLFSGTGSISFEFSSRGCDDIVAVEGNKKCIESIRESAKKLKINLRIYHSEAIRFLKNQKNKYDIIFADPPYNFNKYNQLKDLIIKNNIINDNGCLIIEHEKKTVFEYPNIKTRKYGEVNFSIFYI